MAKRKPIKVNLNAKELFQLARKHGFTVLKGRGKGSHLIMTHEDGRRITIADPARGAKRNVGRNVVREMCKIIFNEVK